MECSSTDESCPLVGAGVPLTSPQLYCAGNTVDLRAVLLHLSREYPEAPLLGVGFSLGAGMLARYLAEEGPRSRFKAACVLGCVSCSVMLVALGTETPLAIALGSARHRVEVSARLLEFAQRSAGQP